MRQKSENKTSIKPDIEREQANPNRDKNELKEQELDKVTGGAIDAYMVFQNYDGTYFK
jgi:hypothetical protein